MGQITADAEIAAHPERVWDAITSPHTFEQWMTIHTKWKGDVPERFEQGSKFDEVVTMLGMANTISWLVEELQEPTLLRISGTGMAGVRTTFEFAIFAEGDDRTNAKINAEFEGQMITGALGKAVEQDGLKNLQESLEKLSAMLA
jgi:uncharacterized protein YndB with AHSA1/START domain